jgi:hypothetical protein
VENTVKALYVAAEEQVRIRVASVETIIVSASHALFVTGFDASSTAAFKYQEKG